MTTRERFHAIMGYQSFDRLPVWFFGTWPETKERWRAEGLAHARTQGGSGGPQLPEMDTDWEINPCGRGAIWDNQGILNKGPIAPGEDQVVEETETHRVVRSRLGGLVKYPKVGTSVPQHLEPDLHPTREDWERFKTYFDPDDPRRWIAGWEERARQLNARTHATCFCAGSLFASLRDSLGIEAASYLPYDDPDLYAEMIGFFADYYIALNRRLLSRVAFDFGYFHEDCCFNTGPLISPAMYREHYDRHYRRMIAAYREAGLAFTLMDSDGKVDDLLPCWLDSGFDIVFPIEVGTWKSNPVELRRRHGKRLRMMGGVNKHVIPLGETAIRAELEPLKPLVAEGGYIPLPDHRIPPGCSLEQFRTYVRVFKDVFGCGD